MKTTNVSKFSSLSSVRIIFGRRQDSGWQDKQCGGGGRGSNGGRSQQLKPRDKSLLSHRAVHYVPLLILRWPDPDPGVSKGLTHSHLTGDNPGGLLPPPLADSLDWKSLGSLVVRSVVTCPPPATTTKHTSPPSKSHRFLPPLSLFLYRCLIRPVTRALSRAVSHPAGLRDGDEERRWKGKGGG